MRIALTQARLSRWSGAGLALDAAQAAATALLPVDAYFKVLAGPVLGIAEALSPTAPGSLRPGTQVKNMLKSTAKSALVVGLTSAFGPLVGIAGGMAVALADRALLEGNSLRSHKTNLETMGVHKAWEEGYDGRGVTIALIDSGGELRKEFGDRIIHHDSVDGPGRHGVEMSSVMAAQGEISGVAPGAQLAVLDSNDENGVTTEERILKALDWVEKNQKKHNVGVVSLSLGSRRDHPEMAKALKRLDDKGIVVVAAVGNDKRSSKIDFPASADSVIAVGNLDNRDSVDPSDDRVDPSSSRPRKEGEPGADCVAPGKGWVSATAGKAYTIHHNGGSSAATAAVAGAVAIWKQAKPELNSAELRELLQASSRKVEDEDPGAQGHGAVQVDKGLEWLLSRC